MDLLIIDSGIDTNHGDLDVDVVQACDQSNGLPVDNHGTLVAGVAAAVDNASDIIGASHGVDLWSSKDGDAVPDPAYTACGVEFGRVNDIFSMNMSTGYSSSYTALADQIAGAWNDGLLMVAAVGNNGGSVRYPAAYAQVIGVAATDINNTRPSWSNYGSAVELAAPGVDVRTTELGGGTSVVDGTSFAAPHVAAAAALLKAAEPTWSNADVRDALKETATNLGTGGFDVYYGNGLLDIDAALDYDPTPPVALVVGINGPTEIQPGATCTWDATVSNGTPPFSYTWYNGGLWGGSGSSYTGSKDSGNITNHFPIEVHVEDAVGATGSHEIEVYEDSGAMICLI